MRYESSITSISWIPSEAMTGPMRVPMDLGIGHYDEAPPDMLRPGDLETLRSEDRYRFANDLRAWIDVDDGAIVAAGYSGGGLVGSTTAKVGLSVTIPGVAFPVLQDEPVVEASKATFRQTAGGRTGAPLPHRIGRPPYLRMTAPAAWTTLSLTITARGHSYYEVKGASPFPRHWIYDANGDLTSKSGLIDFSEWTSGDHPDHTPWHQFDRAALMSEVESQLERNLSHLVMGRKPVVANLEAGQTLIQQGQKSDTIYLILDGMLSVEVDSRDIAELGPGAIVGERAVLEGGHATATVRSFTPARVAGISAEALRRQDLERLASGHHREDV